MNNINEYISIWLGICKSEKVLEEYLEIDYEKEDEEESFIMGEDFRINFYDEDLLMAVIHEKVTNSLRELIDIGYPGISDELIEEIIKENGEKCDKKYNSVIFIGDCNYIGNIREVNNPKYGYYYFLTSVKME